MHVIGRHEDSTGPVCDLGAYRARDGSTGASVALDIDRPHAAVVVGKRGAGKSHTLGVVAEGLARAPGVAPVVIDPMGVFDGLVDADALNSGTVHRNPTIRADALPPRAWPLMLGLSPTEPAGSAIWRAATEAEALDGMQEFVAAADVADSTRRAAANHLSLAESWGVFDSDGIDPVSLCTPAPDVLDLSGLDSEPARAVTRVVARGLYEARVADEAETIPWLLIDEAHAFAGDVAAPAIELLLTRGRTPGVGVVLATQRPSALSDVAVSQADLRIVHRLTAGPDIEAMATADPTYLDGTLTARLPHERGCALVVDDSTESVHEVRIRARRTRDGGATPRASESPACFETVE
ncbi:ATP-binding protein [Haloferax sp. DFSO60]|uniref:ATP-binding protein n=1 Tax=Haloferax sp. DFSO60 TaxID=3388652 RepID=UPI00397D2DA7